MSEWREFIRPDSGKPVLIRRSSVSVIHLEPHGEDDPNVVMVSIQAYGSFTIRATPYEMREWVREQQ